eukprot:COSAG05_NODE_923_length_6573_cov_168.011725_9_plen_117_part_00
MMKGNGSKEEKINFVAEFKYLGFLFRCDGDRWGHVEQRLVGGKNLACRQAPARPDTAGRFPRSSLVLAWVGVGVVGADGWRSGRSNCDREYVLGCCVALRGEISRVVAWRCRAYAV